MILYHMMYFHFDKQYFQKEFKGEKPMEEINNGSFSVFKNLNKNLGSLGEKYAMRNFALS